ncbi:MAG: AAA family ATPase [Prevotella sp.]|nr:AAA family ATPase [Prevotella sp.]
MQELDLDNKEWQAALHLIDNTQRSLFLTGRAGTGKSTFLRYVSRNTHKKHVVLAPTGIAAINVGGQTLHSFFRLPFHPLLPNDSRYNARNIRQTLKYSSDHTQLLRQLELIIIDEISMVRADIIDFIDRVLRIYCRNMRQPFGGKQLLLVGDIYQLEPVLKEDEWRLLQPYYSSAYFFAAHVFHDFQLVSIELQKVYRQTDPQFVSILDRIRRNAATDADLTALNERCERAAEVQGAKESGLKITLATRRDTVDYINDQHLKQLDGNATIFNGKISGDFPLTSLPAPTELCLKPGAQVIFTKNDREHRWVNGTLGVVSAIDEELELVTVVAEDGSEHDVEREVWENVRYTFNEQEQKIEEQQLGTFTQFPLRLAWAITVHKSQGLTFSQVRIDLSGGAFAAGQTYVALSRCTSLRGISLAQPVKLADIIVRPEVVGFARSYNNQQLLRQALSQNQADRAYCAAVEAFDRQDFDAFLTHFFLAIHSRYDIEQPVARRFIRRKLGIIGRLQTENEQLRDEIKRKEKFLKRLAAEYTLLGKECEQEHMADAAIRNYEKALELYPEASEPRRRMERLKKNTRK